MTLIIVIYCICGFGRGRVPYAVAVRGSTSCQLYGLGGLYRRGQYTILLKIFGAQAGFDKHPVFACTKKGAGVLDFIIKKIRRGWIVVNVKTGAHGHFRSKYGCYLIIKFLRAGIYPDNPYLQESYRRLAPKKPGKPRYYNRGGQHRIRG